MDIKKTITYQLIEVSEEEDLAWLKKCDNTGDTITEIEGWSNSRRVPIVSLGHRRWLVPVLNHTDGERYDS